LNEGGLELKIIGLNHWSSDGAATASGSWIDVLTKSDSVLINLEVEIIIMVLGCHVQLLFKCSLSCTPSSFSSSPQKCSFGFRIVA
ncbi:hypothetical protein PIB30_114155, partial [Stylosanthes scabra]|nr:hypothetical protein [Stylosanthes scabra]